MTMDALIGTRVRWAGPRWEMTTTTCQADVAAGRRQPRPGDRVDLCPGDPGTVTGVGTAPGYYVLRFDQDVEIEVALPSGIVTTLDGRVLGEVPFVGTYAPYRVRRGPLHVLRDLLRARRNA